MSFVWDFVYISDQDCQIAVFERCARIDLVPYAYCSVLSPSLSNLLYPIRICQRSNSYEPGISVNRSIRNRISKVEAIHRIAP